MCFFSHKDSSATPVQHPVSALSSLLRRIHLRVRSPLPAPRPMTATVPTSHLWTPPAHLKPPAPHPPVQPVSVAVCLIGRVVPPQLSDQERQSPPQALAPCSSFSIRKRQRHRKPQETRHPCVCPPLTGTQRTRMTSQTPLPPRTAHTSPSPSLTSFPSTKRKPPPTASSPPTKRMLHP